MTASELYALAPGAAVHRYVDGGLCLALHVDTPPRRDAEAPLAASGRHVAHRAGGSPHLATSRIELTPENAGRLHLPRPTCRVLPTPEEDTDDAER